VRGARVIENNIISYNIMIEIYYNIFCYFVGKSISIIWPLTFDILFRRLFFPRFANSLADTSCKSFSSKFQVCGEANNFYISASRGRLRYNSKNRFVFGVSYNGSFGGLSPSPIPTYDNIAN